MTKITRRNAAKMAVGALALPLLSEVVEGSKPKLPTGSIPAVYEILAPRIERRLRCPKCLNEQSVAAIVGETEFEFEWCNCLFIAKCQCGYCGQWRIHDRSRDGELQYRRWHRPEEIVVCQDPFGGQPSYIWKPPASFREYVKKGNIYVWTNTHQDVLNVVRAGCDMLFTPRALRLVRNREDN